VPSSRLRLSVGYYCMCCLKSTSTIVLLDTALALGVAEGLGKDTRYKREKAEGQDRGNIH
jgi:hypothetical protein